MRNPERGFTLVELLIALAVFAVMATMAYGGLSALLGMRQGITRQNEGLARLQMAFQLLEQDIEQMAPRPIRDENGQFLPALQGGGATTSLLEFTRTGVSDSRDLPESHLQRIRYLWQEGRLQRYHWPTLDRTSSVGPQLGFSLDGITSIRLRFLDHNRQWQEQWPPAGGTNRGIPSTSGDASLPLAVEIYLEKRGWGHLRRLFRTPG